MDESLLDTDTLSEILKKRNVAVIATAITHDLVLVTGNTRHFSWMPGLTIEDWRTP